MSAGTPHTDESEYTITISAFGLDEAAQDALFERVTDAAHALDEQVCCSGRPVAPPDDGPLCPSSCNADERAECPEPSCHIPPGEPS